MAQKNDIKKYLVGVAILLMAAVLLYLFTTGTSDDSQPSSTLSAPERISKNNAELTATAAENNREQHPSTKKLEPEIQRALEKMTDTSSEGLVEEPSPESGYEVNLQGRFRSVPVAEMTDDGQLEIKDYTNVPARKSDEQ